MPTVTDIVVYFENGQYFDCINAIKQVKSTAQTNVEKLILETDVVVCQLMQDNSNEDSIQTLLSIASKTEAILSFSDRSFRTLLLQLSCNLMYLLFVSRNVSGKYLEPLTTLLVLCLGTRGTEFNPVIDCHSTASKQLNEILEKLIVVEVGSPEAELLYYLKAFVFLLDNRNEGSSTFRKRLEKSNITECSSTNLPILLLSPVHLPLAIVKGDVRRILNFSRIVLSAVEFDASEVQALSSPCDEILLHTAAILKALQLLKRGRSKECAEELAALNIHGKGSPSSVAFLKHVISAAALSSLGQNDLALHHLRIAVSSPFARCAPPCATALAGLAVQFSQLDQRTEELESWQLALDCVSQPESISPGIHDDFPGFLFSHLGIFSVEIEQIRYNYSRRLLELKEYGKAALLYEESLTASLQSSPPWSLFCLKAIPSQSVRLREYLISLFMSLKYRKVLDICDHHYLTSEDFVIPFIDGLARSREGQWKEALRSLNKAVVAFSSQAPLSDQVHSAVLSRLHLNRAQVLEQLQWFQDCFHAFRVALQASPDNAEVSACYEQFCKQHGFAQFVKVDQTTSQQTCPKIDDFAIQWILSESALASVEM